MSDNDTSKLAALGAAAVAAVAILWAVLDDAGAQLPLGGGGQRQQMGDLLGNPLDAVADAVGNVGSVDPLGALDEALGNWDESVGSQVGAIADDLGPGIGETFDNLANGAADLAPDAVRAWVPEVAVAEGAVNAGSDLFEEAQNVQDALPGPNDSSSGGSGSSGGGGSMPDIGLGSGGWSGIDAPDPEPADPDPVSDPQDRLNDTDGDGTTDTIDLGGLY